MKNEIQKSTRPQKKFSNFGIESLFQPQKFQAIHNICTLILLDSFRL